MAQIQVNPSESKWPERNAVQVHIPHPLDVLVMSLRATSETPPDTMVT